MPDLDTSLRRYVDAAATVIGEDEVLRHTSVRLPQPSPPPPGRRLAAAFAAVAVLAGAVLGAGLLRSPDLSGVFGGRNGWAGIWPQDSEAAAERAQRRADAGDADYAWQAGSNAPPALALRYLETEHGWAGGRVIGQAYVGNDEPSQDWRADAVEWFVIRCGTGANPLYPADRCPPTVDDTTYEVTRVDVRQLVRRGPEGLWVVTGSVDVTGSPEAEGGTQAVPPTAAEVRALMEEFIAARVAGAGAERYFGTLSAWNDPVTLDLYAASSGSRFVAGEITTMSGPEWPLGTYRLRIRLTAEDGTTVDEGVYFLDPGDAAAGRFRSHDFRVAES